MENYRALYKVPAKSGKLRGEKRETARREQKKKREDTFLERRNIQAPEPSPSAPPSPSKSNNQNGTVFHVLCFTLCLEFHCSVVLIKYGLLRLY